MAVTLNDRAIDFCRLCGDLSDTDTCAPCAENPYRYDYLGGHCCAYSASMAGSATACAGCRASWA